MNPALPANLINPAFDELNEVAAAQDINFAEDTAFLFKCWQSYHIQSNLTGEFAVPRARNLFWRIWSNPHLRSISNDEFNTLWQHTRDHIDLSQYTPVQRPLLQSTGSTTTRFIEEIPPSLPSDLEPLPTPESPTTYRISFNEESLIQPSRAHGRERVSSCTTAGSSSRPGYKRTGSTRSITTTATKSGKSRPALLRKGSSQSRSRTTRTSDPPNPQANPEPTRNPGRKAATFDLSSSWQSEDEEEPTEAPEPVSPAPMGSLVEPDFRIKFAETQPHLSSGTSFAAQSLMRKTRSSVRFADETDPMGSLKGKERAEPCRSRADSQVLADSDDSEETPTPGLQRVHSQLSMLIKNKRQESGTLGPTPAESAKIVEGKKKEDDLLRQGREAAAPIIPRSRRGSQERRDSKFRLPSPNSTF